jgi:hypothetical protein
MKWQEITWNYLNDMKWHEWHEWHEMTWNDMKWNEVTWNDMKWHEMTWNDMKWHEMTWNDMKWHEMTWNDMKWHEMTWNDMKWRKMNDMKWRKMNDMKWRVMKWYLMTAEGIEGAPTCCARNDFQSSCYECWQVPAPSICTFGRIIPMHTNINWYALLCLYWACQHWRNVSAVQLTRV